MDGVSAFIVGTISIYPKLYSNVFHSMQFHIMSPNQEPYYHFVCGSSMEFYVEPIHLCIEDTDILMCNAGEMAFTEDVPVLPDDVSGFVDTINCSRILPDPHYPGFMKLQHLG